jgi:hypothetical protein
MSQPPAAKRPRLNEDAPSPFSPSSYPQTPVGQARSPVGGYPVNGVQHVNRPGSMAPPQRPMVQERERQEKTDHDVLAMSGVDLEAEAQSLAHQDFFSRNNYQPRPNNVQYDPNSGQLGANNYGQQLNGHVSPEGPRIPEPSPEERQQRVEARADWEAARHSQYPLWDMFLYGGPLNDRIREKSIQERLSDPQSGVLVNTQRSGPPPRAQVDGFEGATRQIDKGQAILDSGLKGERLRELMSVISLATKQRLTGLVNASARLSMERREHSMGKVPTGWEDLAVRPTTSAGDMEVDPTSEASTGMKSTPLTRTADHTTDNVTGTHSQANGETPAPTGSDRIAASMQKMVEAERAEEEARKAKRAKRRIGAGTSEAPGTPDVAAMEAAVAAEANQKPTKKAQKEALSKKTEEVQQQAANAAVRLATGMMSNRFNKKNKSYSWMTAGKSGTATPTTPSRFPSSAAGSLTGTPNTDRGRARAAEKRFASWDEEKDPGIQARDILLVLETDGRAPKTYLKAMEKMKD